MYDWMMTRTGGAFDEGRGGIREVTVGREEGCGWSGTECLKVDLRPYCKKVVLAELVPDMRGDSRDSQPVRSAGSWSSGWVLRSSGWS